MAKNMGDSGKFGNKKTMATIPNSNFKPKVKAKPMMPKVKPVQADTLHGNIADEDSINQGALKGAKLRNVKTKSGVNRMQR